MLDLATLLLLLTTSATVLGVATLVVAVRTSRLPGLYLWSWALLANAISYGSFGLRMIGLEAVSIVVSNAFTTLSMVLFIVALLRFHRVELASLTRVALWLAALTGAVIGVLLVEQHELRNAINVVLHMTLMLTMAWVAWWRPAGTARLTGELLIMFGALAVALVFVWRASVMLSGAPLPAPLFVPPQVQNVTYLVAFVALLTNTIGFVLMQMERAVLGERELATRDPLTGAFNRRELMRLLDQLLRQSQRHAQPLALLMVDIDHFKRVNDTFGHALGDTVLREVAERMQARLRAYDLLARYGGEEFVVVLPNSAAEAALSVAESLRATVAAAAVAIPGGSEPLTVTVSIGVHARVASAEPGEAERLLAACDVALYAAKRRGRDRVEASR